MAARHIPNTQASAPSSRELETRIASAGGGPVRWWTNGSGERYAWHDHPRRKVLYCRRGAITVHTRDGDVVVRPGEGLDLDPATEHAATVGPDGVECVEAFA